MHKWRDIRGRNFTPEQLAKLDREVAAESAAIDRARAAAPSVITCPLCHEQHEVIRGVAVCPRIVGDDWHQMVEYTGKPGSVSAKSGVVIVPPKYAEEARTFDLSPRR